MSCSWGDIYIAYTHFQCLDPKATPHNTTVFSSVSVSPTPSVLHLTNRRSCSDPTVTWPSAFPILRLSYIRDVLLPIEGDFINLPPTLPRKSNFLQLSKGYSWNIYRVEIKLESWSLNNVWILCLSLSLSFFFLTPPGIQNTCSSVCAHIQHGACASTLNDTQMLLINEEIWREPSLISTVCVGLLRRRWVTYGGPEGQNTTLHETQQHLRKHSNISQYWKCLSDIVLWDSFVYYCCVVWNVVDLQGHLSQCVFCFFFSLHKSHFISLLCVEQV